MSVFYKKVVAKQLKLSPEELDELKKGKSFDFEGAKIRSDGGVMYFALLQSGENLIKVSASQWLVRHPNGHFEILWPEEFDRDFIPSDDQKIEMKSDPFLKKSYQQPTALI